MEIPKAIFPISNEEELPCTIKIKKLIYELSNQKAIENHKKNSPVEVEQNLIHGSTVFNENKHNS